MACEGAARTDRDGKGTAERRWAGGFEFFATGSEVGDVVELAPSRLLICSFGRVHARQRRRELLNRLPSFFRHRFQRQHPMAHLHSTRVKTHLRLNRNQKSCSISGCLLFTRQKGGQACNASGWRPAGSSSPSGGLFRVETAIKLPARACTFSEQAV